MNVRIKQLNDKAIIPKYSTLKSAGIDLFSLDEVILNPNTSYKFKIGWSMEIPDNYFGLLVPRSSLSIKYGIVLKNVFGIIDSDYRDEIIVELFNSSNNPYKIEFKEKIAQLIIIPYLHINFILSEKLSLTERVGGFGSTGRF